MTDSSKPSPLALVICQRIIHCAQTRERSLIGITQVISAARFPAFHPSCAVYLALQGGRGAWTCEFRLLEPGQSKPLVTLPGQLDIKDEKMLTELDLTINGLQFQRPGRHVLQFAINGEVIVERPFQVQQLPPPQPQGAPASGGPPGPVPGTTLGTTGGSRPGGDDFIIRVPNS